MANSTSYSSAAGFWDNFFSSCNITNESIGSGWEGVGGREGDKVGVGVGREPKAG